MVLVFACWLAGAAACLGVIACGLPDVEAYSESIEDLDLCAAGMQPRRDTARNAPLRASVTVGRTSKVSAAVCPAAQGRQLANGYCVPLRC